MLEQVKIFLGPLGQYSTSLLPYPGLISLTAEGVWPEPEHQLCSEQQKSITSLHTDCCHVAQAMGGQTMSSKGHPQAMLDYLVTSKGHPMCL